MSKDEKIQQLQLIEQSMSNLISQKQNFQIQLNELESALSEIQGKDQAYKIVGGLMIAKPKEEIEKDLNSRKKLIEVRIGSLEKQEKTMNERKEKLQKEVMESMQNGGSDKPNN
jgi:prefoldin beta subunit